MTVFSNNALDGASNYNETEVRFHFVDKVLTKLGYPEVEGTYLKLEEKLEYPYFHIGHKSKKKDLPLGYPDYRAGIKGRRGSFVVEAKSPSSPISNAVIEQAHSYAAHAQVGANYFALCDGLRFQIYQTLSGSEAAPIVDLSISEVNENFHQIENLLSPQSIEKNCNVTHDIGLRLADGLGSAVPVLVGEYDLKWAEYRFMVGGVDQTEMFRKFAPHLQEMDNQLAMMKECYLPIKNGEAARNSDGRINASVEFAGVTQGNHQAMKMMGLERMTFETDDQFLSTSQETPTAFEAITGFNLKQGDVVPTGLFGGATQSVDVGLIGDLFVSANMSFSGGIISGVYGGFSNYRLQIPGLGPTILEFDFSGEFRLQPLSPI